MKLFYIFMITITLFILGIALAGPLNSISGEQRSTSELNCSDDSISMYKKGACTQIDLMPALLVGSILGLAGAVVGGKVL